MSVKNQIQRKKTANKCVTSAAGTLLPTMITVEFVRIEPEGGSLSKSLGPKTFSKANPNEITGW